MPLICLLHLFFLLARDTFYCSWVSRDLLVSIDAAKVNLLLLSYCPEKKASNAENVSIWWRHHAYLGRTYQWPLFFCDALKTFGHAVKWGIILFPKTSDLLCSKLRIFSVQNCIQCRLTQLIWSGFTRHFFINFHDNETHKNRSILWEYIHAILR